jgi:hypothetical protein
VKDALELAGFFGAHAIWCVSDGGPLIPLVAYQSQDGKRGSDRFVDEQHLERAVARAKESLEANPHHAESAVLIYDGFITLGEWRTDALFLDIRQWGPTGSRLSMAVPYRPNDHPSGFAVFKPKFIEYAGPGEPDYGRMGDVFFAGVDSHTEGAKVWNQHLDQSR